MALRPLASRNALDFEVSHQIPRRDSLGIYSDLVNGTPYARPDSGYSRRYRGKDDTSSAGNLRWRYPFDDDLKRLITD